LTITYIYLSIISNIIAQSIVVRLSSLTFFFSLIYSLLSKDDTLFFSS